tara:strand:+ start:194 stop:1747 length:1554 start_codon:yes stop_codon:yes gene_type:complete
MGSIKKALKPVTRVVDNIIPNEIKPALPYLAATFGAPYLSPLLGGLGGAGLGGLAIRKGLAGALTNVGTQALLGQKINPVSAAVSGLTLGGGQFLRGDPSFIGAKTGLPAVAEKVGTFLSPDKVSGMSTLGQIGTAATTPLTAGTMQAAFEEAEKANREYDDYVRQQEEAGAADIQSRRDYITRYMGMAGFDQDQIDDALSRYGYKTGGRVGFSNGGSGTLGDSMQSMKILLMKNEIIAAGGGGFGGKDLDDKTDDEIIEIYEGLFSQGKAYGGRIGYRIGGGPVKSFIAKLLGAEPSEEILNKMFEERKNEIFNEMFDSEAGTGAYSMQQMQDANDKATKQAMKELEEFKERIGMELDNPPEGTVGSDVIEQIMGPRKEGRVKEAYGGRIGFSSGKMVKKQNTGRVSQLFQQIADGENVSESMAELLNVYGIDLYSTKADGGIMNLKTGGMPAEMDLRPGGFVPIGAKEKADDVPARLSKNEFVMTADAVRAAGGGSVNKGAKRMYDLMHKLEARV